jgi:hypothetical protein
MKTIITLITICVLSTTGFATELNYSWQAGKYYHFDCSITDNVATSAMGMTMKDKFITSTDFWLYIESVDANGTGNGTIYLTSFSVKNAAGNILASLNDLPKNTVSSNFTVDKKGIFTFPKRIYLITGVNASGSSTNILAYAEVGPNGAKASAEAGGMKVEAYCEFDPATGKMKAGASFSAAQSTTTIEYKVTEEVQEVEVLPYSFLEMLAVPEGHITKDDRIEIKMGGLDNNIHVVDISEGTATINYTMVTDKNADISKVDVNGTSGDGSNSMSINMDMDDPEMGMETEMDMDMDMETEMEGMPDMGGMMDMSSMPGMGGATTMQQMMPDMTFDITSFFSVDKGMFDKVNGTITVDMNMAGMKMTSNSYLVMKYLP